MYTVSLRQQLQDVSKKLVGALHYNKDGSVNNRQEFIFCRLFNVSSHLFTLLVFVSDTLILEELIPLVHDTSHLLCLRISMCSSVVLLLVFMSV